MKVEVKQKNYMGNIYWVCLLCYVTDYQEKHLGKTIKFFIVKTC